MKRRNRQPGPASLALIATDMAAGIGLPPHMPIERFGTAGEAGMVAQTMIACGFMTGQTVQINGGLYMT